MNKLCVFSKKLSAPILVGASGVEGTICANSMLAASWQNEGWNNYSEGWINNGWNNYSEGWVNEGWNNYSREWINNGWSNYSSQSWRNSGWNNDAGGK